LRIIEGTSGSEGTFGFFDGQERRDMYDLVEWAAAQPWSDGNVGMIGISYFAGTQMEAAVERPPHLKQLCRSPEPSTCMSLRLIMAWSAQLSDALPRHDRNDFRSYQ